MLSRGTREQLFLALRLALVASYARRGVVLPLVLDDVLVNFDVGRAKAAALVLRDFARQGYQVLIFTCHEHISKLFKNIKADVRQLPDRLQMPTADDGASGRRSRRTRIEVVPEPQPVAEPAIRPPNTHPSNRDDRRRAETERCWRKSACGIRRSLAGAACRAAAGGGASAAASCSSCRRR